MGKLNQVIAVVNSKKKQAEETKTSCYHRAQKADLFNGISRTYQPKDEDGERLPSESKIAQLKVSQLIDEFVKTSTELYDVVATQDSANCQAKADIKVDGKTVLSAVPATHMLFLEKQLNDVYTFISKLPVLDPSEKWEFDKNSDFYATLPSETARTKKIPKAFEKSPATKEHPAQVEVFHEDVLAGYWKTIKFSGAIPASRRNELLERVRKLQEAVVKAREEANGIEALPVNVGKSLFSFIFS
jgi:hypothetical protein